MLSRIFFCHVGMVCKRRTLSSKLLKRKEPKLMDQDFLKNNTYYVRQRRELAEFFGFETRNKYEIDDESGQPLAYAAEQSRSIGGFIMRQIFGHWRRYEIHIFNPQRQLLWIALHPFCFYFHRLEIRTSNGEFLGAIQRRFAFFTKKFDVEDETGQVRMTVRSPFWRLWTFPFMMGSTEAAVITKKWGGGLREIFTDTDTFQVKFNQFPTLETNERIVILAASLFIDLQYFENNKADVVDFT